MIKVKIKFRKLLDLINDPLFENLDDKYIDLGPNALDRDLIGKTITGEFNGETIKIDGDIWEPERLANFAKFDLPEVTRVGNHAITFDGESFRVGCQTVSKKEMVPVVNYILSCLGYESI